METELIPIEILKERNHKLFIEMKTWWRCFRGEILRDPHNAHLRKAERKADG